jgi:hypothetical protein
MGKIISRTQIERRKGFLYYCGTDEKGFLTICEAALARGGRPRKKKKQEVAE